MYHDGEVNIVEELHQQCLENACDIVCGHQEVISKPARSSGYIEQDIANFRNTEFILLIMDFSNFSK